MKRVTNTQSFIERSKEIYGDNVYDYSEVEYKDKLTHVKLICKRCGSPVYQSPANHFRHDREQITSCKKCLREIINARRAEKQKESWIKRCREKFGNKFDYSKVNYKNNKDKVWIYCNECKKWFEQAPNHHIRSVHGCPYCGNKAVGEAQIKEGRENFIPLAEKLYGIGTYDYSKVDYKGCNTEVIIIDNKTGEEFLVTPLKFLNGGYNNHQKGSKGERLVRLWLEERETEGILTFESEYSLIGIVEGRKSNRVRIDFRVITNNGKEYWIEYNGGYHDKPIYSIKGWDEKFFGQLKRDINVKNYCDNNQDITLIEISHYFYNSYETINYILTKIFIEGIDPELVLKQKEIELLDPKDDNNKNSKLIKKINNLIKKRNKSLKNQFDIELIKIDINSRIYKTLTPQLAFKFFHIGDILTLKSIKDKLSEIYSILGFNIRTESTQIKEFFEIKRIYYTIEENGIIKHPNTFKFLSVKSEYQKIYDSINSIESE